VAEEEELAQPEEDAKLLANRAFIRRVRKRVLSLLKDPTSFSKREITEAIKEALKTTGALDWAFGVLYSDILCDKCGTCCRVCHPIRLEVEDIGRIASYLRIPIPSFYLEYVQVEGESFYIKGTKPCRFLRGNLCSIYPVRPLVCRYYPFNVDSKRLVFERECRIPEKIIGLRAAGFLVRKKIPKHLTLAMGMYAKKLYDEYKKQFGDNEERIAVAIASEIIRKMREGR